MKTKLSLVLAALLFTGLPLASTSGYVAVSVGIAPPAIPIYTQPLCPVAGYIWVPGYWGWGPYGYYWVPGAWVAPPAFGLLWTPGYWAFSGGSYLFHDGYWGPTVGFYGGINYGYGYWGSGYYGGRWVGNDFHYNTAVSRVNTTVVRNTYADREVLKNRGTNRTSFNGGKGGVQAKPTAAQQTAETNRREGPTAAQRSRMDSAKNDPALRAKDNKGKPKAESVRDFGRKNDQESAATRSESGQAATTDRANERTNAEQRSADAERKGGAQQGANAQKDQKARGETAKNNDRRGQERVKSERTEPTTTRHAQRAEPAKRNTAPRQTARTSQSVQHQRSVQHRPPTVKTSKSAPQARGHGPAPQQEQAKKKKKKDKGNGG